MEMKSVSYYGIEQQLNYNSYHAIQATCINASTQETIFQISHFGGNFKIAGKREILFLRLSTIITIIKKF